MINLKNIVFNLNFLHFLDNGNMMQRKIFKKLEGVTFTVVFDISICNYFIKTKIFY